jgi:hypothetical protein
LRRWAWLRKWVRTGNEEGRGDRQGQDKKMVEDVAKDRTQMVEEMRKDRTRRRSRR